MNAYIVNGYRSPVAKANRGGFKTLRPDTLATKVIQHLMAQYPDMPHTEIDDLIVGNAMPEAEQGLNFARLISLMAFDTDALSGMTVNRYCASGLETIAIACAKINAGMADCIIAGGAESMSMIPMGGWRVAPKAEVAKAHPDYYWGMGLTAEQVAKEYKVSREDQDQLAYDSHQNLQAAYDRGFFDDLVTPYKGLTRDQNLRPDSTVEKLNKLNPVFGKALATPATMTAANSTPLSDGASAVLVGSEDWARERNLPVLARFVDAQTAATDFVHGHEGLLMAPVHAVPVLLKRNGLTFDDFDFFEIHEAFASTVLSTLAAWQDANYCKTELGLDGPLGTVDRTKLNVTGSSLAAGHPFAATGARIIATAAKLVHEKAAETGKPARALLSVCAAGGLGAVAIIESI